MSIFKAFIDYVRGFVAMDKKCCCAFPKVKEAHYDPNGDCMVVDKPKKAPKKSKKPVKNLRKSAGRGKRNEVA